MDEIRKIADEFGLLVIEDNAQALRRRRRQVQDRRALRRGLHQLHHPEEPRHASATAARSGPTTSTSTTRSASCATTARPPAIITASASTAASTTSRPACSRPSSGTSTPGTTSASRSPGQYDKGLAGLDSIRLPYRRPGYRHVYHLYEIEVVDPANRDALLKYLNDAGIDAKTHYSIAIHEQEGFPWGKPARLAGPLTNAEQNAHSCISLPMFPELTAEEIDEVIRLLRAWKP